MYFSPGGPPHLLRTLVVSSEYNHMQTNAKPTPAVEIYNT